MPECNIENLWNEYLTLVGLQLEEMHPVQIIETKRAFMAGLSQYHAAVVNAENEDEAVNRAEILEKQLKDFWGYQTNRPFEF